MKVHITLVGGQPAPVYNGIIYAEPDKIVYIYSDKTREEAARIADEVKIPSERRKINPVDLNEIEKKAILCRENFKDDEITVNISGGTKPWAFYFAKTFGDMSNAKVFYVDQNNVVWNFSDKSNHTVVFNIDAQFRLLGNLLEKYLSFSDFNDDDKSVLRAIKDLREFNEPNFFKLVAEYNAKSHLTKIELKNGSSIEWKKSDKMFNIVLTNMECRMEKCLHSMNVRTLLLKAGWFEYEVAKMLSGWKKTREIRMNCIFPYRDSSTKNEIDILVDTGTKLLFVECKTQIEDNTDIDKFRSAVKNYGGLGSKALFVTNARMTEKAREKCADNDILFFSLHDEHLGLSNEQALALLLDSELDNINTK